MTTIMTLSDLHHGKWGTWAADTIKQAIETAHRESPDVLLLGGDLAEPSPDHRFQDEVLNLLAEIPVKEKLWVVGNNDLEDLEGPISGYAAEAQLLAAPFGIHVLDHAPAIVDGVAFLGNLGWFDGSLWGKTPILADPSGDTPRTFAEAREMADAWTRSELGEARMDISSQALFDLCQATLKAQFDEISNQVDDVVLMTHTAPDARMCLYGHSAKYDFLNFYMGWDASLPSAQGHWMTHTPSLKLRLCGHTHRFKTVLDPTWHAPLINVSGQGQPRIFEVG
ncbi:MAG: metallophosphoesterase [Bradymonadia bacterium]